MVEAVREAHRQETFHRFLDPSSILVKATDLSDVRIHGFYGSLVQELSTIGIGSFRNDGDPYLAPAITLEGMDDPVLLDAYSVCRCIAAAMTGDPMCPPSNGAVPLHIAQSIQILTTLPTRTAGETLCRTLCS